MATFEQENEVHHLTLAEYQERACDSNQFAASDDAIDQLRFGFFGEVGGLLSAVKKSHRDLAPSERLTVKEELGDALWYLVTVSVEYGNGFTQIGEAAMEDLHRRLSIDDQKGPTGQLTFYEFDGLIAYCHSKLEGISLAQHLKEFSARVGQLMTISAEMDLAPHPPLEHLGKLFADMVITGALFDQKIEDVAKSNIDKFESRWPREDNPYIPLFDADMPELEKLPRKLSMRFIERQTAAGKPYVIQQLNGVNIGDRLTDNRTHPDGYRFHDVFHLAYMAHLGWSPVIRALLKLKRKSDPDLDENQDGARARIIEEGIATWIFNHAHRNQYYEKTEKGRLDYGLLKQVLDMVDGYEVASCPLWQWETAILEGFRVFRQLYASGEGVVHVNMDEHTIEFEELVSEPESLPPEPPQRRVLIGSAPPPAQESID